MQLFNIGFLEIIFILLLAVVVLGPKDLAKTGRELGKFIRRVTRSDLWNSLQDTYYEVENLPRKLAEEAGADEMRREVEKIKQQAEGLFKEDESPPAADQP
ncbi:hypothetical protein ADN00_03780 [Ornatilinea apprima]|uniref:Translocase n=1 Tax=Ornatilinea apprima TaxID=1134406 RepID=A0A0P6X7K7_9CHLR|nr:twin-arginine translocase TatA/TatE family subunit [Ornatilinea apprima]KPL79021.1 hypothetical protein ADN00_03780 [Ornatilinea apprima]